MCMSDVGVVGVLRSGGGGGSDGSGKGGAGGGGGHCCKNHETVGAVGVRSYYEYFMGLQCAAM